MGNLVLGLWIGTGTSLALFTAALLWLRHRDAQRLGSLLQDAFERGRSHGMQAAASAATMAAAVHQMQQPQPPFGGMR